MKSAITVVITGCNRARRGIVQSLKNNRDGRDVRVIGINNSPYNILRTDVDEFVVAPSITDPEYIPWLRDLCKDKKVDVLIPFIQGELPIASKYAESLLEVGTHVSITDPKSLNLLNDKIALAERYPEYFPAQKVVNSSDGVREFAEKVGYYDGDHPMCCKIAGKCGGLGFAILDEQNGWTSRFSIVPEAIDSSASDSFARSWITMERRSSYRSTSAEQNIALWYLQITGRWPASADSWDTLWSLAAILAAPCSRTRWHTT